MLENTSFFNSDISLATFLAEYWQKKPLLIRNAFPDFTPPIDADELAGLACEEGAESRLIIQNSDNTQFQIEHGPFSEQRFSKLPEDHWTLLVQAVDHWVPEASELIEQFRFIPNWRFDDLMISFASQGGGVGPHYDNYDVFLLQTQGQRRWEVGGHFDEHSPRKPDIPLMIIDGWQPEQSSVLEPGDMLYVPPQCGHNGISQSPDCMTYSIGFRAPSHAEIMRGFTDFISDQITAEVRYQDPGIDLQTNSGEITPKAIDQVQQVLQQYANDKQQLADWFGQYVTELKYPELDRSANESISKEQLAELLQKQDLELIRNESSRFSYYQINENNLLLFVDGRSFTCSAESASIAANICQNPYILINQGKWNNDTSLELLSQLWNMGALYSD